MNEQCDEIILLGVKSNFIVGKQVIREKEVVHLKLNTSRVTSKLDGFVSQPIEQL